MVALHNTDDGHWGRFAGQAAATVYMHPKSMTWAYEHQYQSICILYTALDRVHPHSWGGNTDKITLQRVSFWIPRLQAPHPPGMNEKNSFSAFLKIFFVINISCIMLFNCPCWCWTIHLAVNQFVGFFLLPPFPPPHCFILSLPSLPFSCFLVSSLVSLCLPFAFFLSSWLLVCGGWS